MAQKNNNTRECIGYKVSNFFAVKILGSTINNDHVANKAMPNNVSPRNCSSLPKLLI